MLSVLSFIFVLTIIVFVHEFGHFIVARLNGVKVEVFSIGFGKELFGFTDRKQTRWKFSLIPLGGYVKMFGDLNATSFPSQELLENLSDEEKKKAFPCKSLWQRAAIVAAGPFFNYLLAIIIITFFFFNFGYPKIAPKISEVVSNSPAKEAGIKPGDVIEQINDYKITDFNQIREILSLNLGEALTIKIKDHQNAIIVHPAEVIQEDAIGNKIKIYQLGIIAKEFEIEKPTILRSIKLSVLECYKLSSMTLKSVWQMLTGQRDANELGGPIKIAQHSAKAAENGIYGLFWFIALFSVNLGFINLLPLPALDGGHLLIYLVELCTNKKIAAKIQNYSSQIGIILLIMLTIFITFNDLKSLIIK